MNNFSVRLSTVESSIEARVPFILLPFGAVARGFSKYCLTDLTI